MFRIRTGFNADPDAEPDPKHWLQEAGTENFNEILFSIEAGVEPVRHKCRFLPVNIYVYHSRICIWQGNSSNK